MHKNVTQWPGKSIMVPSNGKASVSNTIWPVYDRKQRGQLNLRNFTIQRISKQNNWCLGRDWLGSEYSRIRAGGYHKCSNVAAETALSMRRDTAKHVIFVNCISKS